VSAAVGLRRSAAQEDDGMADLWYLGLTAGFFILTWGLVRLCERL
jgi:hypothetical protein